MRTRACAAVFVCVVAIALSAPARAASVADEVKRLRTEDQDSAAAIALAEQYLTMHPDLTLERQRVHYELGATQYAAKDYKAAEATFDRLVADYATIPLDKANEAFVVDDAQFYIGVIEHYFGDRARGIAAYEKAIDSFPKSNRRPQALMLLAGVHEQDGDKAKALARFEQLVAEHPKSEQAPEAELHVGHLLRDDGKLDEAIAAFERVAADWPESTHAPTGLMFANRVLMAQEITQRESIDLDAQIALDNEKALVENVEILKEKYGDSDEIAQAMQDMINYYSNPYNAHGNEQSWARAREAAAWLVEHNPGSRQGLRAVCELAVMVGADNPRTALAELDWVIETGRTAGDESLVFDARFAKAQVLEQAGDTGGAKQIWTELLEQASDEHLADEIRIFLILLKPREEQLAAFKELAEDTNRHTDIRSTALLSMALFHMTDDRYEQALEIVERIIAEFPETFNAVTAKEMRGQLAEFVKVPIDKRGDYRPE